MVIKAAANPRLSCSSQRRHAQANDGHFVQVRIQLSIEGVPMCRRRFQVCKSLALLFRNSIPGHVARSPGRRANATGCKVGLELATDGITGIHLPTKPHSLATSRSLGPPACLGDCQPGNPKDCCLWLRVREQFYFRRNLVFFLSKNLIFLFFCRYSISQNNPIPIQSKKNEITVQRRSEN